jgi:hypothetical protein
LSTLIKGSTLILPSACLVPFPECEPISVEAFPISSWVQLIPCFLPSREVDFVKPRIACLEIVYENESACQLGICGDRRVVLGRGVSAEMEPLLMILPPEGD